MQNIHQSNTQEFGKIRNFFWPIYRYELKKLIPMFILFFLISSVYNMLRNMKIALMVTAENSGAEVIPFLKIGAVLPGALLFTYLFTKLINRFNREQVFYAMLSGFLVYFALFLFVLYPHHQALQLDRFADFLKAHVFMADGLNGLITLVRHWNLTLFYVLAEMWSTVVLSVLFWGFANQITNVKNAARFYALYTAGGQVGTIVAGVIVYRCADVNPGNFATTVSILMSIALFVCAVIALVYWWTNNYVVTQPGFVLNLPNKEHVRDGRTKLSLKDSLLFIMRSPYLGLIALMVIGYGISINMVEVSWKAMLKLQFPNAADYQAYMGVVQTILGTVSLLVAVFVGGNVIRRYGWYASAKLTPIVLGLTSLLFFAVYFMFPDYVSNHVPLWQFHTSGYNLEFAGFAWDISSVTFLLTPLALMVLFGTIHNVACKTMKYCLFDTTKEMAYIPLDKEAKIKGKAAVDLVGARFGKSGASWTQLALIDCIGAGSILDVLPLLFPCVAFVVIFWFFAVKGLNKRFTKLQDESSAFATQ